ncbi:dehydrogenase [Luteipulveratus mongoliensis]|uniref:Dehydrogenase n=1 Tax=Luteipulveratus mongoliensis TaxID=571913 RepID=A0A0K1JJM0_9MICO|nr:dehydrogenase [Luteipulveratus mongoliensis]AKU16917.1 dehydrogenase [Luteipulveratus mongoliensis]
MSAGRPLRFGLIGVDSPHAPQFTRLLGDGLHGEVAGARITHAWKGEPAADFPLGLDRVDAFADEVALLGVQLCTTPEEVADAVDALLVVAADARTHPAYFERVAPTGKPVYVDTRFALTTQAAKRMLATARVHGCTPLAGSPKRFAPEFVQVLGDTPISRLVLDGPLPTQPGHPDLSWYGFHLADLAVATLGPDPVLVDAPAGGSVTVTWADGRTAHIDGEPTWSPVTTGTLHRAAGASSEFALTAGQSMLTGLLANLVDSCRNGVPNVSEAEILATVAIVEGPHVSRTTGAPAVIGPTTQPLEVGDAAGS